MKASEIKAKRIDTDPGQVRLIVGGRATYAYLIEPQLDDDEKPEGGKSRKSGILIPKGCPAEVVTIIRQAVTDAVKIGIAKKWGGKKPSTLDLPLNNGDLKFQDDKDKYAAYEGMYHLSAKKKESIGKPILRAYGKIVTEAGVIESGDWCAFDINLYPYAVKGNRGIAVALNGVTLIHEGERFGGGPSADSVATEAESLYAEVAGAGGDAFGDLGGDDFDDMLGDSKADEDDPFAGL